MTAALDDAVTKLAAVAGSAPVEVGSEKSTVNAVVLVLIESLASAPSRGDALKQLVASIAAVCPEATVRGGIGKGRMTRFVDARLGWLGPESTLYQKSAAVWEGSSKRRASDQSSNASEVDPQRPSVTRNDRVIEVRMPAPEGSGRCIVWIEGPLGAIDWLPSTLITIGAVLWSRPSRSLPTIALSVVQRSTWALVTVAVLLLLGLFWPVPYRVACTARVETMGGRFVSAPFEATLLAANVRPGDAVEKGEVLCELDGRPLRLEREALISEIGQASKEYDVALAGRKIADAQQSELRRKQLNRQLDLITDRLANLEVISPINGIVVSGDLERHIGSPLELGQSLIEVAPMDTMRIEIEVPEHEIGFVAQGNETRIKIDAIGGASIYMPLQKLHPQSELRNDLNVFVGSIDLGNDAGDFRPGMRGEATIYGPKRPWIWSWVRGGFERLLWWAGY
ncbi:efflux RND transporter periplasmic adaptor subunit [Rubripirellula reticaptiva]|nr:HlyD family efflux transporter periplasmic adaptor subunit [Rubripirellula reticaptiva]